MKIAKPKQTKRIVTSGADIGLSHRADFRHCPSCDHRMENEEWDKAAIVLVLEPGCYKSGCVSVVSECPKCFEKSWVHHRMGGFHWEDAWPQAWKDRVKELESSTRLKAFREWGAGICWSCKHLKEATVEYHAWRHCIIGSGPALATCPKLEPLLGYVDNASKQGQCAAHRKDSQVSATDGGKEATSTPFPE